jgi:hypothetical protein
MVQGEDSRNWNAGLSHEPDLGVAAHLAHQVSEPGLRLWKEPVALAGDDKQIIEVTDEFSRSTSLILEV